MEEGMLTVSAIATGAMSNISEPARYAERDIGQICMPLYPSSQEGGHVFVDMLLAGFGSVSDVVFRRRNLLFQS